MIRLMAETFAFMVGLSLAAIVVTVGFGFVPALLFCGLRLLVE